MEFYRIVKGAVSSKPNIYDKLAQRFKVNHRTIWCWANNQAIPDKKICAEVIIYIRQERKKGRV
jgi:hypothetical protein